MTRIRASLLMLSGMVIVGGGLLLGSNDAGAAVACSNTWCSSATTCEYRSGEQCALEKSPEVSSCVSGGCSQ